MWQEESLEGIENMSGQKWLAGLIFLFWCQNLFAVYNSPTADFTKAI